MTDVAQGWSEDPGDYYNPADRFGPGCLSYNNKRSTLGISE